MIENFLLINKIERSLSDILRGMPIIYEGCEQYYLVFSAELFEKEIYDKFLDLGASSQENLLYKLIITDHRAKALNIDLNYKKPCKTVLLECKFDDLSRIIAPKNSLCIEENIKNTQVVLDDIRDDDIKDNQKNREINFNILNDHNDEEFHKDVVKVTKEADLLPAAIIFSLSKDRVEELVKGKYQLQIIKHLELKNYLFLKGSKSIGEISRSKIALKNAENAEIIVFRDLPHFGKTHLAIIVGEQDNDNNKPPIVRIHSGCYTGDLLSSLQCDCRDQLQYTISHMNNEYKNHGQYGILIYQTVDEGRGIGLANKIRTYDLQCSGCSTIDANHVIGYEDDERNFTSAINILKKLGVIKCHLMTNNPEKISFLRESGKIEVSARVPVSMEHNYYNKKYLSDKKEQMNHFA